MRTTPSGGYAAATGTNGTDTMRVGEITPTVNVKGGMWEKLTATRTLLGKLIRVSDRDENYKIYGTQTNLYNDTVMQCVRKVELCTTAEEIDAALEEAEKDPRRGSHGAGGRQGRAARGDARLRGRQPLRCRE